MRYIKKSNTKMLVTNKKMYVEVYTFKSLLLLNNYFNNLLNTYLIEIFVGMYRS